MTRLLERLHSGPVILMDGAMGTELICRGARPGAECLELRNLTHPEDVWAIHQTYLDAGAECLLTNTFEAKHISLAVHHLEDRLAEIWQAALRLARDHPGHAPLVLGDVGPGPLRTDTVTSIMDVCRDADGLLLETWTEIDSLEFFASSLRHAGLGEKLPLLVSFTFCRGPDGNLQTFVGDDPEGCAFCATEFGAAALGVNCGKDMGLEDLLEVLHRYRAEEADLPLFVRPNAGTPDADGRYPLTPAALAAALPKFLEAGVRMIGGCCGTTPAHIAALRQALPAGVG